MRIKGRLGVALAIVLALSGGAQAASSDHIGVAAAVRDAVQGTVGGATAPLGTGTSVYQNEVISTGDQSMAQLLFLDQTSLSIGPKSEVKLDRFVYDPDRKQGDVVLEASRGAFRFITGAQDPKSYTLKTPVATIGVRGTILDYGLENGRLVIRLVEGNAIITLDDGKTITLDDPGDAIVILTDGTVIGPAPWNGEIDSAIRGTSFPLYGSQLAGIPDDTTNALSTDDLSRLTDELATHNISSITSPVSAGPPALPGSPGPDDGDEPDCDFDDPC
jgi:FecR protein